MSHLAPAPQVSPPRRKRGAQVAALVFAAVAVLLLIVVIIAIAGGDNGKSEPPAAEQPAATGSVDWASAEAAVGIPPTPDAATAAAYIADLKAIDPDIVGDKDPDRIIGRGRDACAGAKNHPGDQAAAIEGVRKRFTSPSHPDGFTGDVPARIWAVVHARLCPTY